MNVGNHPELITSNIQFSGNNYIVTRKIAGNGPSESRAFSGHFKGGTIVVHGKLNITALLFTQWGNLDFSERNDNYITDRIRD